MQKRVPPRIPWTLRTICAVREDDLAMPTSSISKSRKDRRKTKKATHDALKGEALYFDKDTAIEHVLHFFCKHSRPMQTGPMDTNGILDVEVDAALALLKCYRSLSRVSRSLFRSVLAQSQSRSRASPAKCTVSIIGLPKDISHLQRDLPTYLVNVLETLFICGALSSSFSRAIAMHCTGLRSLTFRAANFGKFPTVSFCTMLAARGGLDLLSLNDWDANEQVISAIAKYCTRVRRLELCCYRLYSSLAPLWNSLGINLENVTFRSWNANSMLALHSLTRNCPNISRLTFCIWSNYCGGVEEICKFYGPRQLELPLSDDCIGIPALFRILGACPNISIGFSTGRSDFFDGASTNTVIEFGLLSSCWAVKTWALDYNDLSFAHVGRSCLNLEKCLVACNSLRPLTESSFSGLFIVPKEHLRYLDVQVASSASSIDVLLSVLGKKVSSLETFSYRSIVLSIQLLEKFVWSQKQLKQISFRVEHSFVCQRKHNRLFSWQFTAAVEDDMGIFGVRFYQRSFRVAVWSKLCANAVAAF